MARQLKLGRVIAIALAAVATITGGDALAQSYPSKPIRLVVPFPPGGGADVTGRTVAQKLTESMGQTVLVENRAGAGGNIATEFVSRAPADGYTILLTTTGHAIQPNLTKTPWDPIRDFAPVSMVNTYALVIAVHPSVPAASIGELVSLAKASPGKLSYGSSGTGGNLHLGAELFKSRLGVDILHVPYKGNAPMTTAVISGEVQMVFDSMTGPLPHIRAGKLRALAVTGSRRSAVLPDVPTVSETVSSGFEYSSWNGIIAPAGTPAPIVNRLNAEIGKALAMADVRERFASLGYEAAGNTPEQFAAIIAADVAKFAKIIKDANIRAD